MLGVHHPALLELLLVLLTDLIVQLGPLFRSAVVLGGPEIQDFTHSSISDHHILSLNIPMHYPTLMHILQPLYSISNPFQLLMNGCLSLIQQRFLRFLHNNVCLRHIRVFSKVFLDIINLHNIGRRLPGQYLTNFNVPVKILLIILLLLHGFDGDVERMLDEIGASNFAGVIQDTDHIIRALLTQLSLALNQLVVLSSGEVFSLEALKHLELPRHMLSNLISIITNYINPYQVSILEQQSLNYGIQ